MHVYIHNSKRIISPKSLQPSQERLKANTTNTQSETTEQPEQPKQPEQPEQPEPQAKVASTPTLTPTPSSTANSHLAPTKPNGDANGVVNGDYNRNANEIVVLLGECCYDANGSINDYASGFANIRS
eukprot:1328888-Amorphochlora_amoeboformis.AAC.1